MCLLPFHHFDDLLYSSKWEAQPIQSTNGSNRRYFRFKKAHFRNKKSRYRGIVCWSFGSWLFCVSWVIPGLPQISWFSNSDNLPTPVFPGAFAACFRRIFCFFLQGGCTIACLEFRRSPKKSQGKTTLQLELGYSWVGPELIFLGKDEMNQMHPLVSCLLQMRPWSKFRSWGKGC